jgi:hypothetical protein
MCEGELVMSTRSHRPVDLATYPLPTTAAAAPRPLFRRGLPLAVRGRLGLRESVLASLLVVCPVAAHADGSSSSGNSNFQPIAPVDQDFDAGLPRAWRTSGQLRGKADQYIVLSPGDTLQYSFRAISSGIFGFSFAYEPGRHGQATWNLPAAQWFDITISPGSFLGSLLKGENNHHDGDISADAPISGGGHGAYSTGSTHNPGGSVGQLFTYSSPTALQAGQDYLLAIRLNTPAQPAYGPYRSKKGGGHGHGGDGDRGGNRGGHDDHDDRGDHDDRYDHDNHHGHATHGHPWRVGLDDFHVDQLAVVSSVPEAHGWAMYAAGLLTVAWLGGRRRSAQARQQGIGVPQPH